MMAISDLNSRISEEKKSTNGKESPRKSNFAWDSD